MGALSQVPEPRFVLTYNQRDITRDISRRVLDITYTDYLSGMSDDVEVRVEDIEGLWRGPWYPGKGDALALRIGYAGGPWLDCGRFEIDEIEFSDEPQAEVSIRALSAGIKPAFRTRQAKAYEATTLRGIASAVAGRHGLSLTGEIRDVPIERVTQYQERDLEFLDRLAEEYGHACKIVGGELRFTELRALRAKPVVASYRKNELKLDGFVDKIKDVFADGELAYHHARRGKLVRYRLDNGVVTASDSGRETSGDSLKLASRADNPAMAQAKAEAALEAENMEQVTGRIRCVGDTRLVAGANIAITEQQKLSGKYLVVRAIHKLDRAGGFESTAEVKRVLSSASAREERR